MMRRSFSQKAGASSEKQVVVLNAKIGKLIPFLALVRGTQNLRRSARKYIKRPSTKYASLRNPREFT